LWSWPTAHGRHSAASDRPFVLSLGRDGSSRCRRFRKSSSLERPAAPRMAGLVGVEVLTQAIVSMSNARRSRANSEPDIAEAEKTRVLPCRPSANVRWPAAGAARQGFSDATGARLARCAPKSSRWCGRCIEPVCFDKRLPRSAAASESRGTRCEDRASDQRQSGKRRSHGGRGVRFAHDAARRTTGVSSTDVVEIETNGHLKTVITASAPGERRQSAV